MAFRHFAAHSRSRRSYNELILQLEQRGGATSHLLFEGAAAVAVPWVYGFLAGFRKTLD